MSAKSRKDDSRNVVKSLAAAMTASRPLILMADLRDQLRMFPLYAAGLALEQLCRAAEWLPL